MHRVHVSLKVANGQALKVQAGALAFTLSMVSQKSEMLPKWGDPDALLRMCGARHAVATSCAVPVFMILSPAHDRNGWQTQSGRMRN